KRLFILAGTILMIIGIIGIFVPVLPTTPFLLLAAACYARGSDRLYRWLLNNRVFGGYIRSYVEGRGMPLKIKLFSILLLWITIGLTVTLGVEHIAIRIGLILIAIGVTLHISLIKAKSRKEN
ncbi:MAG: hypothetical protein A2Y90_00010, partial [Chloroflexi bacterium RBG_13_52_12]